MKALIIGATGLAGLYLIDYINRHDYHVIATGLKPNDSNFYKSKGMEYFSLYISEKE